MDAEPADVWTESKSLQLIREFRKRPIMWDQKNHLFYKKEFKKWAWVEISKVVQMPVERCISKMSILMSSFRREKSKMVNTLKRCIDPAEAYQSSWYGFKEMSFMLDKDSERKLHATENSYAEKIKKTRILKRIPKPPGMHRPVIKKIKTSPTPVHQPVETPKSVKTTPFEHDADEILQPKKVTDDTVLKTYPASRKLITASESKQDEIKFFANFVATKMMKYSETTKNAVQQAICEVIFKADQNYYESNANEEFDPLRPSGSSELPSNDYGIMKIYFSDSD